MAAVGVKRSCVVMEVVLVVVGAEGTFAPVDVAKEVEVV